MRRGEISVQDHAEGDRHTVNLGGELDLATAPELVGAVYALLAEGAREIVLDVGALTFIDSTGIRSILSIRELCELHECEFGVTLAQEPVQRVFKIAGLQDVLPFPASQNGAGQSTVRRMGTPQTG